MTIATGNRGFSAVLAVVLLAAAAPAAAQYRSEEVAGWQLDHTAVEQRRAEGAIVQGPWMGRRAGATQLYYQILGGLVREVGVQRFSCGSATDENGGTVFIDRVYFTGSEAQLIADVQAAVRTLDANYDQDCPARPAELAEALSGMDAALAQVERWASEDSLPPIEAWSREAGEVTRTEPPVEIVYDFRFDEGVVIVAVDECGEGSFWESAPVDRAGGPVAHGARAREALAGLLRSAAVQCALNPAQAARLSVAFDEAVAEAEAALGGAGSE